MDSQNKISDAFLCFMKEAPEVQQAWMEMVQKTSSASALDKKTSELAYIAVLAATGLESGLPFHVGMARDLGATREEIISAVLLGLPAAGHKVIASLPVVLNSF